MSRVSESGRRNDRGGVIVTITIMMVLALSSCSTSKGLVIPGENLPNERGSIFRAALWESTDQDVQGNASDPGGHVDVTNVVCGPSFGSGFGLEGYILKIGEIEVGGASFDAALNVAAWHEEVDGQFEVKYRILHQWLDPDTQQLEDGMSEVYTVENPDNADQQYPAVTAHLAAYIPMKGIDAELNFYLIIDIAYEKVLHDEKVIMRARQLLLPGYRRR